MQRQKAFTSLPLLLPLMLLLSLASAPAQSRTNNPSRWESEMRAFEAADRTNPPPHHAIFFYGSSTFRLWKNLSREFPGKPVINRGFGGSQLSDAIAFADRVVLPYEPRVIVMYEGDNDLAAGKSPEQVVADYKKFVSLVHARLPETRIAYLSIKPSLARWKLKDKIEKVNQQIAAIKDPHLAFIDVASHMLTPEGKPRPELFQKDGLHPNAQCYQMWVPLIAPYLN